MGIIFAFNLNFFNLFTLCNCKQLRKKVFELVGRGIITTWTYIIHVDII